MNLIPYMKQLLSGRIYFWLILFWPRKSDSWAMRQLQLSWQAKRSHFWMVSQRPRDPENRQEVGLAGNPQGLPLRTHFLLWDSTFQRLHNFKITPPGWECSSASGVTNHTQTTVQALEGFKESWCEHRSDLLGAGVQDARRCLNLRIITNLTASGLRVSNLFSNFTNGSSSLFWN